MKENEGHRHGCEPGVLQKGPLRVPKWWGLGERETIRSKVRGWMACEMNETDTTPESLCFAENCFRFGTSMVTGWRAATVTCKGLGGDP